MESRMDFLLVPVLELGSRVFALICLPASEWASLSFAEAKRSAMTWPSVSSPSVADVYGPDSALASARESF
jgi:hypothetical protein